MTEVEKELIKLYRKYIKLLTDELNEVAPIAANHGWASSRYKIGKKTRSSIKHLERIYDRS